MDQKRKSELILYGRITTSVVLYALFIIFSTSAVLTRTLADKPYLLGGLLVGAVVLLPRTTRRPKKNEQVDQDEARRRAGIQKWLTYVRLGYFLVAVGLWFGLPELV